ncbi:MAG TPA: MFS transporter [Candidatus Limnocylindrales bacterium]|nr:MFS transporter [Candidatus Limnocylindrales bacterium]
MTALAMGRVRSLPILRALDTRDFRLLWTSEAISVIGDQFHFVALSWLVISITGSGLALGTVLIAIAIPRAILLVPFGVVADRRPGRTLMLTAHLVRGGVVGAIAALALSGQVSIPLLAVLGALFGAADALYMPAQQAFLPRTLEPDRLPSANALLQGTYQVASILGPPLAGAVIALTSTGVAFAVDATSFVLASIVILMLSKTSPARAASPTGDETTAAEPHEGFRTAIAGGIRYVLRDRALLLTMVISLVINLALNGPVMIGMPWLADQRFGVGPAGLGLLVAAWSVGALVGVIVAGSITRERQGWIVLGAVVVCGIGELLVGVLPSFAGAWIALAVLGVAIGYANIVAISWIQRRVDHAMTGRVMSLVMLMGFGITPLSLALSGLLVDLDATVLFVGAGLLVLATALVAAGAGFVRLFDEPVVAGEPEVAAAA